MRCATCTRVDEYPSLNAYLGSLESEDLFVLRDQLRDLEAMPGWQAMQELVQVQRERSTVLAVHHGQWVPTGLDGLIRAQAMEGHVVGYLKGLEHMAKIMVTVERTADAVGRVIDEEARK